MNKWLTISLGAVLGISHIGMIGLLSNRESKLPSLDIPVGPYTSYLAEVNKEGYRISYKANDPKTMYITKDIKEKGGFLGLGNNIQKVTEEYTMDGAVHTKSGSTETTASSRSEECIKAIGGAENTGRLVGSSVGASVAPSVANIPIIGLALLVLAWLF